MHRLLAILLVVASACSSPGSTPTGETLPADTPKLRPSGFLSDYSKLSPSRNIETEGAYVYKSPATSLSVYKLVMLEPVKVRLRPGAAAQRESAESLKELAQYFEGKIRENLGTSFPIVDSPGFGVMIIRAAIVDATPNMPISKGIDATPLVGGAAVEMEILDSVTRKQIAAAVDSRAGDWRKLSSLTQDHGYTKELLEQWASYLRDGLDESRGLHRGSTFGGKMEAKFR